MGFNQFIIQAGNTNLETYDDESILLNYSIVDITNIASRNTSFTKEITIPGTPINNEFFQRIFDVNIDLGITSYNPKRAIPAKIIIGGSVVFQGNLQLLSIVKNQKQVEYNIVLTGILKNLLYNFGDYNLQQLDLSEYNHQRNKTTIQDSWDYQIVKNSQGYDATNLGEGYVYPYIIYGNSQDVNLVSYVYDNYPAVYVKTIMDKMFEFGGYTYTSSFFNSDYFKKLIVPFINDNFQLNEEQFSGLTTTVGVDVVSKIEGGAPALSNSWYSYEAGSGGNTITGFRQLTPVRKRASNFAWQTNATMGYYLPLDLYSGSIAGEDLQNPFGRWVNINSAPNQSTSYYQASQDGFYKVELEFSFMMKYINMVGGNFRFDSGSFEYYSRLWLKRVGQPATIIDQAPIPVPGQFQPTAGTYPSPWYDTQTVLNVSQGVPSIYLNNGDKIYVEFVFNYPNAVKWRSGGGTLISDSILAVPVVTSVVDGLANYFNVEPVSNNIQTPVLDIDLTQILPNMKMKDFFMSIVKMFNLYVYDNPFKTNDLIVEPMDLFYSSKTKLKDWTNLLDRDSDIEIVPMSELDVRSYKFSYTEDSDYFNEQYTEEIKEVYGEETINFVNDFSNEDKKIDISFSPTPDSNLFIGNRVAPFFTSIENNTLTPVRPKPRILFYDGKKGCSFYQLKDDPTDTSPTGLLEYAYCGMWDDPYDPKYDLGYGKVGKIYWGSNVYPNNNLIDLWYETTFNEITDVNGKLLKGSFYLSVKEISDFDFRDIIYLDGSYWRVNKIEDYDPVSIDKLTNVELYRISDIRYYPLEQQTSANSSYECPQDIVAIYSSKGGFIYVSQSGQPVTKECCENVGGIWANGVCKRANQNIIGNSPSTPASTNPIRDIVGSGGGIGSGGNIINPVKPTTYIKKNASIPFNRPVSSLKDLNAINSPNIQVQGKNNFVPSGVEAGIILGNNNTIRPDFSNVLVVGNNISPTEDNSILVGDLLITTDGIRWNTPYIIDGGLNEVMNVSKTNLIDIIDGGYNSVRNFGGDSKLRPIIDGTTDLNE
jgi:hypothetical protein